MFEKLEQNNHLGVKVAAGMLAIGSFLGTSTEAHATSPTQVTEAVYTADKLQTREELQAQIEAVPDILQTTLTKSKQTVIRKLKPGTNDMVKPVEARLNTIAGGDKYLITYRYDSAPGSIAIETFDIYVIDAATGQFKSDTTYTKDNDLLIATYMNGSKTPQVYINGEAANYSTNTLNLFATNAKTLANAFGR